MDTEHDPRHESPKADEESDSKAARNKDNPSHPDDAGEKGAGSATGAIGGLDEGSEPEGEDIRQHERP